MINRLQRVLVAGLLCFNVAAYADDGAKPEPNYPLPYEIKNNSGKTVDFQLFYNRNPQETMKGKVGSDKKKTGKITNYEYEELFNGVKVLFKNNDGKEVCDTGIGIPENCPDLKCGFIVEYFSEGSCDINVIIDK